MNQITANRIYNEDCLQGMARMDDGCVDAIITDLPYGMLNKNNPASRWDQRLPLPMLWEHFKRIKKPHAPIILFGQGMFTAELMMSCSSLWRYNLVWLKDRVTGHLNANRMPLRIHEDIIVFYEKPPVYHPQMQPCHPSERNHSRRTDLIVTNRCYGRLDNVPQRTEADKYPSSVIFIPKEHRKGAFYHPTQKPVALMEYLIRTYTDEGALVLDCCIGSGTTAIAAIRSGRDFVGFEIDKSFYDKPKRGLTTNLRQKNQINDKAMNAKRFFLNVIGMILLSANSHAQQTFMELEQLTVNEQVTTVITANEPIRFVDISTDKVAGDHPINNTLRLKPKECGHTEGDVLAIVTIVTERYRTQYALVYTARLSEAVADKEIMPMEQTAYHNPAVSLSTEDMYRYARTIWTSPAMFRNVSKRQHRMTMRLNNIYSVGDYFFIDFSIDNRTNIRFEIDEVRLKLTDKRISMATNSQTIELKPEMMLEHGRSFLHGYRNVLVVKKMTFPNDKVLTIEMSEKQISGRTISINIDYEDVLSADTFNKTLLRED